MKKFVLSVIVLVIVAVAGVVIYGNTWVRSTIEAQASRLANTEVKLGSFHVKGLGSAEINQFSIANPKGFSDAKALTLGNVSVQIDPSSLLSDTIVIKELSFSAPELQYEITKAGTNIGKLADTVAAATGDNKNDEVATQQTSAGKNKKQLIIENLFVRDGKVNIASDILPQVNNMQVEMPEIHLTNIGKEGEGVSYAQVASILMQAVLQNATAASVNALPSAAGEILQHVNSLRDGIAAEALQGQVPGMDAILKSIDNEGASGGDIQNAIEGAKEQVDQLKKLF